MKRQRQYRLIASTAIFAFTFTGCALNVRRDETANLTNVEFRVGLQDATLVDGTAALPAYFDLEIGSDVGDWFVQRGVEAATQGTTIFDRFIRFLFGWLK